MLEWLVDLYQKSWSQLNKINHQHSCNCCTISWVKFIWVYMYVLHFHSKVYKVGLAYITTQYSKVLLQCNIANLHNVMILLNPDLSVIMLCRRLFKFRPQKSIIKGVSPRLTCRTRTLNAITLVVTTLIHTMMTTMMLKMMILLIVSYFLMQPVYSHN